MEVNKRKCKVCNVIKTRITDGKFDEVNKRHFDENKHYWNGSTCPDCNLIRVREKMKGGRLAKK